MAGTPALADICTLDEVPAATLLVPYFEVDLDNAEGVTTLFSINNAAAAPALAHVVFWTDWSYPTLSFEVYLTGYDVVSVNLRDVFDGDIPITSDAASDPNQESIYCGDRSPCGGGLEFAENRHWDDTDPGAAGEQGFPFCDRIFPGFANPVIIGQARDRIRSGHTGGVVASLDACVGLDHGDNVARGYITIDSVSQCSLAVEPSGEGFDGTPYFAHGGTGIANNNNQLWGDWFLIDSVSGMAQGETMVHIEADSRLGASELPEADPDTGLPLTGYTFYGRYFPNDGRDNREPLGTIWAGRYLNDRRSGSRTDLLVWRDSTSSDDAAIPRGEPGDWCQNGPSWYPLDETEVLAFDQSEEAVRICMEAEDPVIIPGGETYCFPTATGRHTVGEDILSVPYLFGWLYLNLNQKEDDPIGDHDFGADGHIAQSYVMTLHRAQGRYSAGFPAIEVASACFHFNEPVNRREVNGGVNVIPQF